MQSDIDLARSWRRAFFSLFVTVLGGSLIFAATGGPGLLFYIVGAIVFALLGFDLLIRVRVERADRASARAVEASRTTAAARQASINSYSSRAGDCASVIGGGA